MRWVISNGRHWLHHTSSSSSHPTTSPNTPSTPSTPTPPRPSTYPRAPHLPSTHVPSPIPTIVRIPITPPEQTLRDIHAYNADNAEQEPPFPPPIAGRTWAELAALESYLSISIAGTQYALQTALANTVLPTAHAGQTQTYHPPYLATSNLGYGHPTPYGRRTPYLDISTSLASFIAVIPVVEKCKMVMQAAREGRIVDEGGRRVVEAVVGGMEWVRGHWNPVVVDGGVWGMEWRSYVEGCVGMLNWVKGVVEEDQRRRGNGMVQV